jgi:hypothetical protein
MGAGLHQTPPGVVKAPPVSKVSPFVMRMAFHLDSAGKRGESL